MNIWRKRPSVAESMDPDADGAIVERIAEWLPDCDEPLAWIAEATGTTYPVSDTNQQVPERLG